MKNLKTRILQITAITVIMLFMSSSVFAQIQETQQDTTTQDTTSVSPQDQNQRTNQGFDGQEPDQGVDYSETIEKSELPQEVNSSLKELYPAHKVSEVFKGEDDSYKVKVKNETDEAVVYYSSEGKFLRAENLTGLQQEGTLPQEQGQRTGESQSQGQWGTESDMNKKGTQSGTWGTGTDTDDDDTEVETESGTFGTDSITSDRSTEQKSQSGTWGTGTETDDQTTEQSDNWGTGTETDNRSTQSGTWGTGSETDDRSTQSGTWGTGRDTLNNEGSAYPQEQSQRSDESFGSQDDDQGVNYSEEVEESDLPNEVTTSLKELYPAHEISEIQKGDDDSYKVKVKNENDEAFVYYSSEGDFLRAKSLNDMQGTSSQEQGQRTFGSQDQSSWSHTHQHQHESQMGTGKDKSSSKSGTQGAWGTGTDNTGTKQDKMGTGSTGDDDNWGTEEQGAHQSTWGDDSDESSEREDESSAYPQEQNQQSDDQEFGSQRERDENNTWGTEKSSETGTDRSDSQDDETDNQFGVSEQDTTTTGTDYTSPQEQSQMSGSTDDEYTEQVMERDIPESIKESVEELYPDHKIEKAHKGNDGSYKVKLKEDDHVIVVYYDANGTFQREENKDKNK